MSDAVTVLSQYIELATNTKIVKRGGAAGPKSFGSDGLDDKIIKALGDQMTVRLSKRFIAEGTVRYYKSGAGKICVTAVENTNVPNAWFNDADMKVFGVSMDEFVARLERMGITLMKKPKRSKPSLPYYD